MKKNLMEVYHDFVQDELTDDLLAGKKNSIWISEKTREKYIMGIKTSSARLLAYLKRKGESDLRSVCMLGRQGCFRLGKIEGGVKSSFCFFCVLFSFI